MNEAKELIYHGMQPEEDVMPKVKYEDIPEDRRKKWSSHLATFDGVVSNDDEFEEWLAVWMHNIYKDGDYEAYMKMLPQKYRDSEIASLTPTSSKTSKQKTNDTQSMDRRTYAVVPGSAVLLFRGCRRSPLVHLPPLGRPAGR